MVVTNVGRSTARIYGWTVGDGKFQRREHTLKADDTWKPRSPIEFADSSGNFAVTVHFSSSLHERMTLDVVGKVRTKRIPNGGVHYSGRVKSARRQTKDDRQGRK
jgi:hypothetical protein